MVREETNNRVLKEDANFMMMRFRVMGAAADDDDDD
jgi:hypothetical protein